MFIRKVGDGDRDDLQKIADEILFPIYGDQTKALSEWLTGNGFKRAYVLIEDEKIGGLLSLKANPAKSYLKISTLVIVDGFRGRGGGKTLLNQAECFAEKNEFPKMIVTVSETRNDSLAFFEGAGFITIGRKIGKYQENIAEIILEKEVNNEDKRG